MIPSRNYHTRVTMDGFLIFLAILVVLWLVLQKGERNRLKKMKENLQEEKNKKGYVFKGVYRYTVFGKKEEVFCPRCGSENCSHYQEQKIIPGKTKTRYTANLNPLKPFTLVNKKEKVVRQEQVVTDSKFVCNSCGNIFL